MTITPPFRLGILQSTSALWVLLPFGPFLAARGQEVPRTKASALEQSVNLHIRPGDDFVGYANGAWLKATAIPKGNERWGARDEINEVNRQRLARLLDDARTAPAGSPARKVADFHAAWLNQAAIEAKGIAPLRLALDSIDRIGDRTELTQMLGRGMRADVDPLNWGVYQSSHVLGLSVEPSIHGEKSYVAFLLQGGLGLPDRAQYLSSDSSMQTLRRTYQAYVGRMLTLAGFDHVAERAAAVVALETAIAASQATREASANDHNADQVWTRADFARQAPGMDWSAFLEAAGLAKQETVVAWQPSAVKGLAALVSSQPLDTWRDYLRFHLIDDYAEVLPRAFVQAAWAMHRKGTRPTQSDTRVQRGFEATQFAMSDAIGRMYADRYFPAEQKKRVQAIVANVAAAFVRRVEGATWMSPATKALALAKLKTLYVGIGYPEYGHDDDDLKVDPLDALGNVSRVAGRDYRRALARVGQPVNMQEWWIAPQTVGALLVFQQNGYFFSAALLQAPKFDPTASVAADYGAIGAIIAHDISHFIDVLGAEYGVDGAMRRWWNPEDMIRFQALATPLVQQFSAYHPFPNLSVDGKLTETENIADLAGLSVAFDAYRLTLGSRAGDTKYLRRQDREFFLGFAQSWRVKLSDRGMRTQLSSDHAPEMYRVATVRNFDAWYDAFGVTPGQLLYLEPTSRVRIW